MTRANALRWLARSGYWARGVVYLVLGWLATAAALSDTQPPSLRGALAAILEHPFGWLALAAVTGGLFGYAAWRAIEAVLDLHDEGAGAKGLAVRAATMVSAALHVGLGLLAAATVADWDELVGGAGVSMAEAWTALVLAWPLGRWLVGLVGVGAIAMGIVQAIRARRMAFEDIQATDAAMRLIRPLGRLGLGARGTVFGVVGGLFVVAAWQAEADEAGGVRDVLAILEAAPLGEWLTLVVAAGLAVYGVFSLVEGWYQRPASRQLDDVPDVPAVGGEFGPRRRTIRTKMHAPR